MHMNFNKLVYLVYFQSTTPNDEHLSSRINFNLSTIYYNKETSNMFRIHVDVAQFNLKDQ